MDEAPTQQPSPAPSTSPWGWIIGVLILLIIIAGAGYYFGVANKGGNTNIPTPTQSQSSAQNVTVFPTTSISGTQTTSPSSLPTATVHTVTLTANGYTPNTLTVKAGDTVTWINNSGESATVNSDPHPTHTNYPPLNLGIFQDGGKLSLKFPTPGTYGYHNHLNPSERGTIVVE